MKYRKKKTKTKVGINIYIYIYIKVAVEQKMTKKVAVEHPALLIDRKSTRLNSSHSS